MALVAGGALALAIAGVLALGRALSLVVLRLQDTQISETATATANERTATS